MTAPAVERSTAAEVATTKDAILGLVDRSAGIPLTDLLDELVLEQRCRVEVVSRALTSLLTDSVLDLLPTRIVVRRRAAEPVQAAR